jgi:hypothetical protein
MNQSAELNPTLPTTRQTATGANGADMAARRAKLTELVAQYERSEQESAEQSRRTFLALIQEAPQLLAEESFSRFMAEHIEPGDFASYQWDTPEHVISFWETLYSSQYGNPKLAPHVENQVKKLLRYALQQFEQQGRLEAMFRLLWLAPTSIVSADGELLRLRNHAYAYEMGRVRRYRRFLYGYLIAQIFLIVLIFPLLFINAENGRIQRQIEQATDLELNEPGFQLLSYSDGLYWALITAASIGYGDVTPVTTVGRVIAAILGVMGVITIGVTAGLVLQWITPRRL